MIKRVREDSNPGIRDYFFYLVFISASKITLPLQSRLLSILFDPLQYAHFNFHVRSGTFKNEKEYKPDYTPAKTL